MSQQADDWPAHTLFPRGNQSKKDRRRRKEVKRDFGWSNLPLPVRAVYLTGGTSGNSADETKSQARELVEDECEDEAIKQRWMLLIVDNLLVGRR